ncbi:MAG: hypothetical protein WA618_01685, partial [Terriglobales bacterium]
MNKIWMKTTGKFGAKLGATKVAALAVYVALVVGVFCTGGNAQIIASQIGNSQIGDYGSAASAMLASDSGAAFASDNDANDTILTIRKRVDEVNVLFIATDRHGKFVRNLNQKDFAFTDDHKPVESIIAFRPETDLPIELGLLMDVSGSVQG